MSNDLGDVSGSRQTVLGEAALGRLRPFDEGHTAHAPWVCRLQATVWWRAAPRGDAALASVLPAALAGARPLGVAAAMVRYLDTPVGPYQEVLAGVLVLLRGVPTLHVPFIAVDSPASVVGGRREWALPKTEARFGAGPGVVPQVAAGDGWTLTARAVSSRLPPVPAGAPVPLCQVGPGGAVVSALMVGAGVLRPATVDVVLDADDDLAAWLPAGRCRGATVTGGRFRLGSPTVG